MGRLNSMRMMSSTLSLEGSAVVILGGLAAFRPIPLVCKWVFCLLLLWDRDSSVCDGGKMCVCYIKFVGGLDGGGGKSSSGGSFLDKQEVE